MPNRFYKGRDEPNALSDKHRKQKDYADVNSH